MTATPQKHHRVFTGGSRWADGTQDLGETLTVARLTVIFDFNHWAYTVSSS